MFLNNQLAPTICPCCNKAFYRNGYEWVCSQCLDETNRNTPRTYAVDLTFNKKDNKQ